MGKMDEVNKELKFVSLTNLQNKQILFSSHQRCFDVKIKPYDGSRSQKVLILTQNLNLSLDALKC